MDKENVVYTLLYSATKKNEIMSFTGEWIELKIISLSEIRQTQKAKYYTRPWLQSPGSHTQKEKEKLEKAKEEKEGEEEDKQEEEGEKEGKGKKRRRRKRKTNTACFLSYVEVKSK
jgi:hypothetical protein